ncbi:tetratricopeptide repeat protein [Corynebacterium sp. Marseille-P4321]|uniref:tetratricopeptide repeat protein n=1 Tax=Corynebacterium sp. Marseille-P4321 TaxID=2736603 RepID=UPI00158E5484|nr:tetratricopeptide repeat protein [Corynebacterium sp. Marseille-P4321]
MAEFTPGFTSGAVDLGALAQRREAQAQAAQSDFQPFVTVDEKTVEAFALERSQQVPVVLLIGSDRAPDSVALKNALERVAAGQKQFAVAYVDADATPQVAQLFGVKILPTVVALAAGRPVTSFEGGQPEDALEQWVAALVTQIGPQLQGLDDEPAQPQEDPRLSDATAALNAGDFDAATAIYDAILADDPANAEIKQAKATVKVIQRLDPNTRETDPISQAQEEPEDVDKQLLAADAEIVAGAPERAFDRLLALVRDEPRAKERLFELFEMFEPSDSRVIAARTKLANALF